MTVSDAPMSSLKEGCQLLNLTFVPASLHRSSCQVSAAMRMQPASPQIASRCATATGRPTNLCGKERDVSSNGTQGWGLQHTALNCITCPDVLALQPHTCMLIG